MNYSSSYYGLRAFDQTTGVVHDASASTSVVSSSSPVAWIVTLGSGETIGTATSSTAASAEKFVLQLSSEYSYGTSGYGTSAYGVDYLEFGTSANSSTVSDSIRVRTATATCSASSINTASGRRVPEGSALVHGTSSNTVNSDANGTRIRTSPQLSVISSAVSMDAVRVREQGGSQSIAATTSANGEFIVSADGAVSASSTVVCSPAAEFASSGAALASSSTLSTADRILDCSTVSGEVASSSVCDPAATFAGNPIGNLLSEASASAGYVKRSSANVRSILEVAIIGREKWEPSAPSTNTWTDVTASSDIWTNVA